MPLSDEHIAAVERQRRIVVNFDASYAVLVRGENYGDADAFVDSLFTFYDINGAQADSIWWNWSEGNQAPYESELLPLFKHPLYERWIKEGTDIVGKVLEATQKRGLEGFYSHRMNGSDNELGDFAVIPMKVEHPEWQFHLPWAEHEHNGMWNFALPEVHDYVFGGLKEVFDRWPFDGLELDFARGIVFQSGEGWINREKMTGFVRRVRAYMQELAAERGRPMMLAARIPDTIVGCHFDGLDVETWVREQLVDMFVVGVRALVGHLPELRRITDGTHVKLYPAVDDHHASDGYVHCGIEIFRGAAANWFRQGADGMQAFNFMYAPGEPFAGEWWPTHRQFYLECGTPKTLARKDKTFIVERRGGGHGGAIIPNAEDWYTPRYYYNNTNMLAPLPAPIDNNGKVDALLSLEVADDVQADADTLESLALWLLLSDPAAEGLPESERFEQVMVAYVGHAAPVHTIPPARGIEKAVTVRINNIPLTPPEVDGAWLVIRDVPPQVFAVGSNLVGVCIETRTADASMQIEKLELRVRYR